MKAILTYHSIDSSGSVISMDEDVFRAQLRWLASGVVRVVPLEQILSVPSQDDAVAITFDDGFECVARIAAPILAAAGLPATVFVVTDRVGTTNSWGGAPARGIPTLPLLGWSALARLADSGLALGSHTRTHPRLAGLPGPALAEEVVGSADQLAAVTGRRPTALAYPYGSVDQRARQSVAEAYAVACTTELRPLRDEDDPHLLPRLDMHYFRAPGRLERWGTMEFRRRLWLRLQARRVRQRLAAWELA